MLIGAVAGLVTITPACGFVDPTGAFFIGLIAGNDVDRMMMMMMACDNDDGDDDDDDDCDIHLLLMLMYVMFFLTGPVCYGGASIKHYFGYDDALGRSVGSSDRCDR
jgi:ammonia channel protein AmtB